MKARFLAPFGDSYLIGLPSLVLRGQSGFRRAYPVGLPSADKRDAKAVAKLSVVALPSQRRLHGRGGLQRMESAAGYHFGRQSACPQVGQVLSGRPGPRRDGCRSLKSWRPTNIVCLGFAGCQPGVGVSRDKRLASSLHLGPLHRACGSPACGGLHRFQVRASGQPEAIHSSISSRRQSALGKNWSKAATSPQPDVASGGRLTPASAAAAVSGISRAMGPAGVSGTKGIWEAVVPRRLSRGAV